MSFKVGDRVAKGERQMTVIEVEGDDFDAMAPGRLARMVRCRPDDSQATAWFREDELEMMS